MRALTLRKWLRQARTSSSVGIIGRNAVERMSKPLSVAPFSNKDDTSSLSDLPESDKYWDREKQIGGDGLGQAGVADWDERKMDA